MNCSHNIILSTDYITTPYLNRRKIVLKQSIYNYFWPDSHIVDFHIEHDLATIRIFNDGLKKEVSIACTGFAGITDLCIWDDMIILDLDVTDATQLEDAFMQNLYRAYDINWDFGERSLKNGMLALKVKLTNDITFTVYCQKIEVFQHENQ